MLNILLLVACEMNSIHFTKCNVLITQWNLHRFNLILI